MDDWLFEDDAERDACRSECKSGKRSLNRLQRHVAMCDDTTLLLFQYSDMRFRDYGVRWSPFTKLCKESVSEHCHCFSLYVCIQICILTRLPSASAIIRLHCATSKSSLWYMGYVACDGAFECPHTKLFVQ